MWLQHISDDVSSRFCSFSVAFPLELFIIMAGWFPLNLDVVVWCALVGFSDALALSLPLQIVVARGDVALNRTSKSMYCSTLLEQCIRRIIKQDHGSKLPFPNQSLSESKVNRIDCFSIHRLGTRVHVPFRQIREFEWDYHNSTFAELQKLWIICHNFR